MHERGGGPAAVGLGDLDIAGLLEFAEVYREVPGGHPQDLLQPREGDPVTSVELREGRHHPQACLCVDDRVELRQLAVDGGHRRRSHPTRPATSSPPPPATASTSACQPGPQRTPITLTTLIQAPRTNMSRSTQIALPAM